MSLKGRKEEPAAEADVAVDEEQAVEDEEPAAEVAPESEDEEEDEGDTYADWNVPSWQELIASLSRPDRWGPRPGPEHLAQPALLGDVSWPTRPSTSSGRKTCR
jgi:hypothetical protein